MGTTNTTTGSNTSNLQFNPIAQGAYNKMVGGASDVLGGYITSPFSNAFYNLGAAQSQKGAQQAGANNIAALMQNKKAMGIGGQAGQGWLASQLAQTGRANQAMSSQANVGNVLAALQRQMAAAGTGLSFSPQLTGQSGSFQQQQTQSGLGTWLPQVLGAGLSAATMGMGGGMGMPFGSVGGMSNPGLGSPSYMPGGAPAPTSAFPGFGASTGIQGGIPNYMFPMFPPGMGPK